jgi:hypothetical protein
MTTSDTRAVIALFLPDASNDYQGLVRDDATRAAARAGLDLVSHSAGNSVMTQIQQLFAWLHGPDAARTRGLVVMPVLQTALDRVVREGARAGVPWAFIQRRPDKLDALRAEFPEVPLFIIPCDAGPARDRRHPGPAASRVAPPRRQYPLCAGMCRARRPARPPRPGWRA